MPAKVYKFDHLKNRRSDGTLDFDATDWKLMLLAGTYTFDPADTVIADLVAHEIAAGGGYSAGGAAVDNMAATLVDDAAASSWAAGTAYKFGDIRRPTVANGHVYMCIVPGTSHGSTEPTWPTADNSTVTDNGIVWLEIGGGYLKVSADNVVFPNSTITARWGILYRDATVGALVKPVALAILFDDSPADVSSTNSDFTVQWANAGILNE